jgi:hypothetical protein
MLVQKGLLPHRAVALIPADERQKGPLNPLGGGVDKNARLPQFCGLA